MKFDTCFGRANFKPPKGHRDSSNFESLLMESIATELSALATDDARQIVKATKTILKNDKQYIRNLCKPCGVQLAFESCTQMLRLAAFAAFHSGQ